ncbi:MAG: hypothetical protein MUF42_00805 [Cytophagaceae bacterium]|jgi:hypothetical protein|nr:hypothetical protein [Cytophagaceae bacterium]
MRYLLSSILILLLVRVNAQVDTSKLDDSEVDTIVIVQSPHVIRKTVVLDDIPRKKRQTMHWGVLLSSATSYNRAFYNVCSDCKEIFDTIKYATRNSLGYRFSFGAFKYWDRWGMMVYGSVLQHRQNFSFEGNYDVNKFSYSSWGIEVSYALWKAAKNRMDLAICYEQQQKQNVSGSTVDEEGTYTVVPIATVRNFRQILPNAGGTVRYSAILSKHSALSLGLIYRYEMLANTVRNEPYIEQRHTIHPELAWRFYIE